MYQYLLTEKKVSEAMSIDKVSILFSVVSLSWISVKNFICIYLFFIFIYLFIYLFLFFFFFFFRHETYT